MPLKNLFIIRFALVLGVILVTAVSFWFRRAGAESTPEMVVYAPTALRYAVWGVSGVAVVIALFIRQVRERRPAEQQGQLTLAGWMPGEAAALLGVVYHIGGGRTETLTVGLLAFAAALLILPLPGTQR